MDYDDTGYLNYSTFDELISPEQSTQGLVHAIIFAIFCTVGACANAIIIFTILNFKKMHTAPNIFLANWAIADLCSLTVTPSGYRIISVLIHTSISSKLMCSLTHFGTGLHLTVVLFVTLVTTDWLLAAHFPKASANFRLSKKFVITSVWLTAFLICGVTTALCISDEETRFATLLLMTVFGANFLTTFAVQFSRALRKYCLKRPTDLDHPGSMLTLTTGFVVCWFFSFLVSVAKVNCPVVEIVAECALFGSSVMNLGLLFCLNEDFKNCLLMVLGRSSVDAESVSDFDNPIRSQDIVRNKDLYKICFDNDDELLVY